MWAKTPTPLGITSSAAWMYCCNSGAALFGKTAQVDVCPEAVTNAVLAGCACHLSWLHLTGRKWSSPLNVHAGCNAEDSVKILRDDSGAQWASFIQKTRIIWPSDTLSAFRFTLCTARR